MIMKKVGNYIVSYYRETDKFLWLLCVMLSGLSLLLIWGILETGYASYLDISRRNLLIQGVSICLGMFCAAILSKIDYRILTKLWKIHVPVSYLLLLVTFFVGVGVAERPDDKRWLVIPGTSLNLQPAEILRISFILVFAYHIYIVHEDINRPHILLTLLIHGAIPVVLVHFQGDDGTALMFLAIIACMLFAAGINWKYVITAVLGAGVSLPVLWYFVLNEFQKTRILILFDPSLADTQGSYYQQHWAKMAFAMGGAGGRGLMGVQHTYVPEMHNDFIFAFLGESFGFVGCLLTLAVILAMWIKILVSSSRALDIQGRMICIGVFAMLSFQSVINIGMNISLLPVIGNTLPFISYGGSSVLTSYLGIGLVLSVYMHSPKMMFD